MNCSLKSDGHEYSPHNRIYIEISYSVSAVCDRISVAHSRELCQDVKRRQKRNEDCVAILCHYRRCLSFQTLRVSSCSCPSLHLFATLENSMLRLFDLILSVHVSMYSSKYCCQCALSVRGLFDAIRLCIVEELVAACETKFNVGFDFATILSSPFSSCFLFVIVSRQLVELKFWEQQTELKWLMWNKWRRLFQ